MSLLQVYIDSFSFFVHKFEKGGTLQVQQGTIERQ